MNIYQIAQNKTLICGYDSLGGGCIINQLHFEFLMLDDFMNEINQLPIELRQTKDILETKLKYKNDKEISMFDSTTTIKVSIIQDPCFCWKIEAKTNKEENTDISSMENLFQNSISHIANLILSKLIDKGIPHNIIMTNQGKNFYLIPRKFEDKKQKFNSCWNDLAGLITCKEQKSFDEINEQEDEIFKPIILDDQKRISTEANANNKIIEKIMNNLEEDINKIKMLEIDINNKSNEKNNLKKDEKHEMIIYLNNSKEKDSSVAKKDNSKIDLERNKNNENINDNIKEKKQKKYLKKENIGKVINNSENLDNQKQKQIKTKENERNKIAENNKQKIKFNNKYLSNTTKKKLYFNEKSNNVLKQLKKNLTKEQNFGVISPMSEMKTEKKQNDFRKKNKNKIFSADKGQYNFSSRNSKNKYVLINNRVKSNQKPLLKNNNFSNVKRKTSNKIFNIINIINNNFNSNESDIRMRNYFSTSYEKLKNNFSF